MLELVQETTGVDFGKVYNNLDDARTAALSVLSERDESQKFHNNVLSCSSVGQILNEVRFAKF